MSQYDADPEVPIAIAQDYVDGAITREEAVTMLHSLRTMSDAEVEEFLTNAEDNPRMGNP